MAVVGPPSRRELDVAARPARRTIYVFERPVRIVHWTIVLALIVLSITGFYIYDPFLGGSGMPGHPGFAMGEMRFIHETAGFVFIAAVLFRIYWGFVGNRYVRWRALIPITKGQRRGVVDAVRFYAFLDRRPPRVNGHNALAGLAYVALYALFIITILTGLGLYAWILRRPPWTTLFSWTASVMSVPALRLVHFFLMFLYIGFAIHHVYSATLFDIEERNGELSSIVTGSKANLLDVEDDPATQ
jgi:Ni/Fe-hydrogenase 1 B-type cytochrome subunit